MILSRVAFLFITRRFTGLVRERASVSVPQAMSGCFGAGIWRPRMPAVGRLPPVDAYLRTPSDPDAVTGMFGKVLSVQGAEKVAEAREADDELVPEIRLAEFAGEDDGCADPGV